jgi:hypothetical protein
VLPLTVGIRDGVVHLAKEGGEETIGGIIESPRRPTQLGRACQHAQPAIALLHSMVRYSNCYGTTWFAFGLVGRQRPFPAAV